MAAQITSTLVGDPAVSSALGLPSPNPAVRALLDAGGSVRRMLERLRPPPERPSFWPGRPAGRVYPDGYSLDQLGPRT